MSQLLPHYRVRNSNLDLERTLLLCHPKQLSDETHRWSFTKPINIYICNKAEHKLYVKLLMFFKLLIKLGQHKDLWCFLKQSATGTVWGVKSVPSNKALSMAETQGSPRPSPQCAKGFGSRTSHAQLSPAAPYRGNIFPFQVIGEAKTRGAHTRLTGMHTKLTQSQKFKQHLRR